MEKDPHFRTFLLLIHDGIWYHLLTDFDPTFLTIVSYVASCLSYPLDHNITEHIYFRSTISET